MPQTYRVTDPATGRTVKLTGDSPPTEAELTEIFTKLDTSTPAPVAASTTRPPQSAGSFLDLVKGTVKSGLGLVEEGGQLIRSIPGVGPLLASGPEVTLPVSTKPSNTMQAIGKTGGDIAQFFVPGMGTGGAIAKAAKAGALTMAQTGSPTAGAVAGGATGALGKAIPAAKKVIGALGERVERALVKPSARDLDDGFRAANVFKHKVGGTLEQTIAKTDEKLRDLSGKLKTAITQVKPGGQPQSIDVIDALDRAAQQAMGKPAKTMGQNASMAKAVETLLNELEPVLAQAKASTSGKLDLWAANELKQGIGSLGAWKHNASGQVVSEADKAMETVANAFYDVLKKEIEGKALGPVKLINKDISELLSIKHAVARRIPVEQRQNVINLGDMIGFGTGAWGISLANRVLRSGNAANVMNTIGQSSTSPNTGRVVSAAIAQGAQ